MSSPFSLFSKSSHILSIWCDVKEHTLSSWRTTSSKNYSGCFQIRLPGAVFSCFFYFCHKVDTHGLPLPIRALRHSHSSLRFISLSLQQICPSCRDGCREQRRETTRIQSQKSRCSDDYVKTEGEGPSRGHSCIWIAKLKSFETFSMRFYKYVKQVQ